MHPETGDEALGHVREDAVDAAFGNIADMDLDIRQAGPLNAILQRKASVGEIQLGSSPTRRSPRLQPDRRD